MGQFPVNPIQIIQQIMGGQNPTQLLMNILMQNMGGNSNNPVYNNLATLTQKQDVKGLEAFARNMASSMGLNFDKEFSAFKQRMGI